MKAFIKSTGSYLPVKTVSNDELAKTIDTSDEWIFSHTGIHERHIAAENEAASDLALHAARRALHQAGMTGNEIDMILVATSTPDYPAFPSTACLIQDAIKARNAGAMDITAACTGFVYGLATAENFIKSSACKNVLVVSSEVFSRILDWKHRNTCVLFGDGAGAVIVSACGDNSQSCIHGSILGSRGSGHKALYIPHGGSRRPLAAGETVTNDIYLKMDGREVYMFAVSTIKESILTILETHNYTIDDVAYIVPHQANVRILKSASKRTGIPMEKFYINLTNYANTSAATIPIALDEMNTKGLLKRGDLIITVGFGAGLTYGANIINW